jgi:type II secretory pathway component HofQ
LPALPVVCRTNHGIAIIVRRLPVIETAFATRSAASGRRSRVAVSTPRL